MKASAVSFVVAMSLASVSTAQTQPSHGAEQPFQIQISAGVAQNLLIHKADLQCPKVAMPARITGTVVVAFELNKEGDVRHAVVVSGPVLLRKPVLDAVRQYKYKPYLLNGKAVGVETTVSVAVDTARDCPNYR